MITKNHLYTEEQALIDSIEQGEWLEATPAELAKTQKLHTKRQLQSRPDRIVNRIHARSDKTTISLRLDTVALETIRNYAERHGIGYQTFLGEYIGDIANEIQQIDSLAPKN